MSGIDLPVLWFILIAVLFAGYFLLEGFDFGVGILLPFLGRDEARRSAMIRTIGPVWDGNEVWLITAGGALFAAFPEWYATMFSGFYLPLFLILVGLIVRVVGLEWRMKVNDPKWRKWCDAAIITGSWLPPVLWGVAVANLVRGVPVDETGRMSSSLDVLAGLLNPFALLGGLAMVAVFVLHALTFLRLKTSGTLRDEAGRFLVPVTVAAAVLGGVFLLWLQISHGKPWTWAVTVLGVVGVLAGAGLAWVNRDGWAFGFTSLGVLALTALAFGSMYPFVMPSSLPGVDGMSLWDAASNPYTLTIMTWAAAIVTPLVIGYQAWTYWVFRKRITAEPVHVEPEPAPAR